MTLEVKLDDLHRTRLAPSSTPTIGPDKALLAVHQFGFSANNVTYAVFGDAMGYWTFFPTTSGWGRIPVWGFADVVDPGDSQLSAGERVYGYLPMSNHLVVEPASVSVDGFVDASAHREALPPAYNRYTRCAADPVYDPATEALQMLLRPLFMTDFVLDDYLGDNDFFGGEVVVISSASAKTAYGLAYLVSAREGGPAVIGLTSESNVAFVEGLGCYDTVLPYDDVAQLDGDAATVFVDIAGDASVRSAVHTHVRGLVHSAVVGGTHWQAASLDSGDLPGPAPAFFFAPDQIRRRSAEWGPKGVEERFAEAWERFLPTVAEWIDIAAADGFEAIERTYLEVLDGRADPRAGFICTP